MTLHFQDEVATNLLTIDATDPKSGTAEFKATAIRVEKLHARTPHPRRSRALPRARAPGALDSTDGPRHPRPARIRRGAGGRGRRTGRGHVALGGRRPRRPGRRPVRARRARGARAAPPPAAGLPRDPGPCRLDQPARPRVRLPASHRPAGRGLRRRGLLPDVLDDPAAAGRGPRLRGPRLPPGRRGGGLRGPRAHPGARRRAGPRRRRDLAPHPLPRPLRARSDGALHGRRPRPRDDRGRPGGCGGRHRGAGALGRGAPSRPAAKAGAERRGALRARPPLCPPGRRARAAPPGAGPASPTPAASTTTSRPAATADCGAPSRSARPR